MATQLPAFRPRRMLCMAAIIGVLSQISILGQNPKIGYQKFNGLQTPKLSKQQICDRTHHIGAIKLFICHYNLTRAAA
jgi:hypothetical protein